MPANAELGGPRVHHPLLAQLPLREAYTLLIIDRRELDAAMERAALVAFGVEGAPRQPVLGHFVAGDIGVVGGEGVKHGEEKRRDVKAGSRL